MLRFDKVWLICFVFPLCFDRVTKYIVASGIVQDQDITSFLEVYMTFNRGISWGIASSENFVVFFMVSLVVALMIAFFTWYVVKYVTRFYTKCASLLILSGALSNFFDRLWYGGVVDFIRFHWSGLSFPVFNFADVFISLGVAVLLYLHLIDEA